MVSTWKEDYPRYVFFTETHEPLEDYKMLMTNTFSYVTYDVILLHSSALPLTINRISKYAEWSVKFHIIAFNNNNVMDQMIHENTLYLSYYTSIDIHEKLIEYQCCPIGWSTCNALCLYSWTARFESQLGHRLSSLRDFPKFLQKMPTAPNFGFIPNPSQYIIH
jgi:hypothetical protein